nr:protein tramtrack, alpha isoform [Onthophagus taurus]
MLPQQYCLRWRYHHSNLQTMFSQLLEREAFCDVVLACEGKMIKAHKIVLSACSTYFDTILSQFEEKDPILIMKDVKYTDIKCLVEFMYKGEINVDHNHLATLLKTAEELRIKGLAEVSWRDQTEGASGEGAPTNGVQTALPHVSTVMEDSSSAKLEPPAKRKRGRPPIDDYDSNVQYGNNNKGTSNNSVSGGHGEDGYSDALSSSEHDLSIWEEENPPGINDNDDGDESERIIKVKTELKSDDEEMVNDAIDPISVTESKSSSDSSKLSNANRTAASNNTAGSGLTSALEKEWPDVIKMNDYLNTGRRQQFWEEPFTKRVMDAIKNKNLEMKIAAELLGVSYGTLYGRYRDAYGCLKHPYRIPNASPGGRLAFWSEQGPTDVLLKLKRKEITLFRAAEQLNVTPQTLSNYLISMSVLDSEVAQNSALAGLGDGGKSDASESEESEMLTDPLANATLKTYSNNSNNTSNSVLANCPDITIIKKEKSSNSSGSGGGGEHGRVNNNADHSDQLIAAAGPATK